MTANRAARAWTTPEGVLQRLRRKWEAGTFLAAYAEGLPFEPLRIPINGPSARELADRLDEARRWAHRWEQASRKPLRLDYREIGGRLIGTNRIPCAAWIDDYDGLWRLLGTAQHVDRFTRLLTKTRHVSPAAAAWAAGHPLKLLALADTWDHILATVRWIACHANKDMYLRQIDVPGVDTKFIERHRTVLSELLDRELEEHQIDLATPRARFAQRYGFRTKPTYIRFRLLDSKINGFSELSVRTDEFTSPPSAVRTVFVVENEITYLAFPPFPESLVIFGGGYAVGTLQPLGWLGDVALTYWGDIDTHGFAILDRLRGHFPHASSLLMDRDTLIAHSEHWVTEPEPTRVRLHRLTGPEADLYHEIVQDALGPSIRLEQERIRLSALDHALHLQ